MPLTLEKKGFYSFLKVKRNKIQSPTKAYNINSNNF